MLYTGSYNHARRLCLEKLLYLEPSIIEVPAGVLNHVWIQVVVSEVKRPSRNRFGSETVAAQIYSGYNV